jgi:hypothetical protein
MPLRWSFGFFWVRGYNYCAPMELEGKSELIRLRQDASVLVKTLTDKMARQGNYELRKKRKKQSAGRQLRRARLPRSPEWELARGYNYGASLITRMEYEFSE